MIIYNNEPTYGYNSYIELETNGAAMMMDMGYLKMKAGDSYTFNEPTKEIAVLLLCGEVTYQYNGKTVEAKRPDYLDYLSWCLHAPKNTEITVTAKAESELYVQKTLNDKDFAPVMYTPDNIMLQHFGEDILDGTMHRRVRTFFDYEHAPYSNMVLGEVVSLPGRWSGYVPHHHPQPEIYFYKFPRPEGFGAGFLGDDVYKLKDNSLLLIPEELDHPQVTAPGYPMLTVWGIRHIDGNPWLRSKTPNVSQYEWLLQPNAPVWQFKGDKRQ